MRHKSNLKALLSNRDEPTVAIRRRPELQLKVNGSFQRMAHQAPECVRERGTKERGEIDAKARLNAWRWRRERKIEEKRARERESERNHYKFFLFVPLTIN